MLEANGPNQGYGQGRTPSEGSGEGSFLAISSFWGLLALPGHGGMTPIFASAFPWWFLLCVSVSLCVISSGSGPSHWPRARGGPSQDGGFSLALNTHSHKEKPGSSGSLPLLPSCLTSSLHRPKTQPRPPACRPGTGQTMGLPHCCSEPESSCQHVLSQSGVIIFAKQKPDSDPLQEKGVFCFYYFFF